MGNSIADFIKWLYRGGFFSIDFEKYKYTIKSTKDFGLAPAFAGANYF